MRLTIRKRIVRDFDAKLCSSFRKVVMAHFRKKPVEIEAWLWDETKETFAVLQEAGMNCGRYDSHATENYVRNIGIRTLEGTMRAEKGDWIIKGIKGEFYPCKPDIFAATYDAI